MLMLVRSIRVVRGGVCVPVVVGEHDFQMPRRGADADGMVPVQPRAGRQEGGEHGRVARCETEQQEHGNEWAGALQVGGVIVPAQVGCKGDVLSAGPATSPRADEHLPGELLRQPFHLEVQQRDGDGAARQAAGTGDFVD